MTKMRDPTAPSERLLTLKDAAITLNASVKTVRRRIDSGELAAVKDGRLIRIHPRALAHYIATRQKL